MHEINFLIFRGRIPNLIFVKMQVFQFQKTFSERLDEYLMVLSWKDHHISASQVKNEWAYFVELQIEPAGWQAIWKIPRNTCEKFKLRYPTIVFGFVEHVNFPVLSCIYNIIAVQDESVHLPERLEVALEDLWPTIIQENSELNVERTADIVDRLRFFYTHVWMPWDNDNDDDFNWVEKHLQPRLQLCFEMREQKIRRPIASLIRSLIDEAKYIQQKREFIEEDMFEDDSDKIGKKVLTKPSVTQLMQMHLRLTVIRSHIEMLENPDMRAIYDEFKFKISKCADFLTVKNEVQNTDPSCYVITLPSCFAIQCEILKNAEDIIPKNASVCFDHSLQNVLDTCKPYDKIFLSPGSHMVHFGEYFFTNGQLSGIESKKTHLEKSVRIYSPVSNSSLLMFDGDFILENIELDCQNILAGIVVKHGSLTMRNCKLVGNGKSSIQQGIICNASASVHMEKCFLENFATGIILSNHSSLTLKDSTVTNCKVGVEMSELSNIKCYKSSYKNCSSCCIYVYGLRVADEDDNVVTLKNFRDLEKYPAKNLQIARDCCVENCFNFACIINEKNSFVSRKTLNYIENVF